MSHGRPVCSACEVSMRPHVNGVRVVEWANVLGPGPYKLWFADEWQCPKCGHRVIVGFSEHRVAEHYEPGFNATLQEWLESGQVRHDRECMPDAEPCPVCHGLVGHRIGCPEGIAFTGKMEGT